MIRVKLSMIPGALLSVFIQNMLKLYALQLCKLEAEEDWDSVETLDNLFCSKLPEFQYMDHLEAQERVRGIYQKKLSKLIIFFSHVIFLLCSNMLQQNTLKE